MSRFQDNDEEEDELQMILEGRDVEEYRDYHRIEDDPSLQLKSNRDHERDDDSDDQRGQSSHPKKQRFGEKSKQKSSSAKNESNREFENDFRDDQNPREVTNNEINENESKIKVKVRRTLKPQPKLNAERLIGSEGLPVLPQLFSDFKFGPKGSELKDLNAILFRFSHWSHRLFPSLTFDDFVEKCEQLGHKKPVKTFVSKIRYDLELDLNPNVIQLEDDDQQNQNSDDFNDKDFDYIIANSFGNITDNTENQRIINDSHFEDLRVADNQSPKQPLNEGSQLPKTYISEQQLTEFNDKSTNSENHKYINDSDEEELSEEQLLREINDEEEPNE